MTRRQMSSHKRAQRRQRIVLISGVSIIAVAVIIVLVGLFIGEIIPMNASVLEINGKSFNMRYYIDALELAASNNPDRTVGLINSGLITQLQDNELLRQGAEMLGITVSDDEVKDELERLGFEKSNVNTDIMRVQLVQTKLKDEYFDGMIPVSDAQVNMQALMLEDETVAADIRGRIASGDNVTDLAREYGLNYYSQNEYFGDFGWHPAVIYTDLLGTQVPIDYAFNAAAGDLSEPLADNETSKRKGYWLLKVNSLGEVPGSGNVTSISANVTGLLLSSESEATEIKARIEAGEDVAALAAEYSNYSLSKANGGELGTQVKPAEEDRTAISEPVDAYIFAEDVEIGAWSDPVADTLYWTVGGEWVVKVVDTAEDMAISDEDREYLIDKLYSDWLAALSSDPSFEINVLLTDEQQARAISKVEKALSAAR
ncbi:MAG: peptidylprolyl isomerase [Dehalococcoidales bacterium]|nr:peptidylprolyl isomerase [Dehalococcoidales bacterium]